MVNKKLKKLFLIFLLYFCLIPKASLAQLALSVAVTAGKSIFKTVEQLIILETANNQKPTISQGPIAFIADTMIYDEANKVGYAYGNLRFADAFNRTFFSAEEGAYFTQEKKIVLRKGPELLLEQDATNSIKINGTLITIYPDQSYVHVQGNIEVDNGDNFITGDEVRIWNNEQRMLVTGNVQSLSGDQKLSADRLSLLFNSQGLESYVARGDVVAVNPIDNFTMCAGILAYERETDLFRASDNPLVYFREQNLVSYANVIEYNATTQIGNMIGNVVAIQTEGEQKAYSRWAVYNGSNNLINMYGNPRLEQNGSELFGTEIVITIESNSMDILGGGRGFFNRN